MPGLLLPGKNLGEIRRTIPARFWPPGFLLLGKNLGKIRGRILARFWPPGFLLPSKNLGEIRRTIPARFWPPAISLPGEIPTGKKNFGGIPPRSWSLFYKGSTVAKCTDSAIPLSGSASYSLGANVVKSCGNFMLKASHQFKSVH